MAAQGLQLCCTGPAIILHRGCNYTAHGSHYQHMVAPGKQNTAIRVVLSTSFGHVTFLRKPLFQAPGDCYETPLYAWFRPHWKTCAPRARETMIFIGFAHRARDLRVFNEKVWFLARASFRGRTIYIYIYIYMVCEMTWDFN